MKFRSFAMTGACAAFLFLAACSSSTNDASGSSSSSGSSGTTSPAPSCGDACTKAQAGCADLDLDACKSRCGSFTAAQVKCISSATSCDDIVAAESCTDAPSGPAPSNDAGPIGTKDAGPAQCSSDAECGKVKCVCKLGGNIPCQSDKACKPKFKAELDATGCQTDADFCASSCGAYDGTTSISSCP